MNKYLLRIVLVIIGGTVPALAQTYGTDNHQVTVQVSTITMVSVDISSISMTITGAGVPAGQDQMTATNTSSKLRWGVNSSSRKITAQTNLATPLFALNLLAVSPTQGTAAAEATLSTTAQDIMLNIGRSLGECTLQYTGIALASQGTGTDSHTITFTVTTQ
ncbi:MAG: hypothetical protein L0Y80_02165 [Ignavibacteriae bacterium]|nr:hypothetical protein [Ignavibacteriota bacterium]